MRSTAGQLEFILEKAVNHGGSPHPAYGHLLPASGAKERLPSPACGRGVGGEGKLPLIRPTATFSPRAGRRKDSPRPLAGEGLGVRAGGRGGGWSAVKNKKGAMM
jgi:hypothetical protein